EAPDGVRHTIWTMGSAERSAVVAAFCRVPALYIADGHHRAASAARARDELRARRGSAAPLGEAADCSTMLGVAFPHDQVQILPYNRTVKNLGGLSSEQFLDAVRAHFSVVLGPAT